MNHVSVITRDHDLVVDVLHGVLGLPVTVTLEVPGTSMSGLFDWEPMPVTVRSTILGEPPRGSVEVIDLPEASIPNVDRGRPSVGPFQLCFDVRDVPEALAALTESGAEDVRGPIGLRAGTNDVIVGSAVVADVRIMLATVVGRHESRYQEDVPC
jgi:hypothetical protein